MISPALVFPYPSFRPNQEAFVHRIHEIAWNGEHAVVNAPTGFGKTTSVLAAVLPVMIEHDLRLIYTSRTHTQLANVMEELENIFAKGVVDPLDSMLLKGRTHLCQVFKEPDHLRLGRLCHALRAQGKCKWYNRFEDLARWGAIDDVFHGVLTPSDIIGECRSFQACPYYVSLFLSRTFKVIACNYNWLFTPGLQQRFLEPFEDQGYILVVDEAHNVPGFIQNQLSREITMGTLQSALHVARKNYPGQGIVPLLEWVDRRMNVFISRWMPNRDVASSSSSFLDVARSWTREDFSTVSFGEFEINARLYVDLMEIDLGLDKNEGDLDLLLEKMERLGSRDDEHSPLRDVAQFIRTWTDAGQDEDKEFKENPGTRSRPWDFKGAGTKTRSRFSGFNGTPRVPGGLDAMPELEYFHYCTIDARGVRFKASCLDPAPACYFPYSRARSSISMSGTLDSRAFSKLCLRSIRGIRKLSFPSPFSTEQVEVHVIGGLSSRYCSRSPGTYRTFVSVIAGMIPRIKKNVGVFCPSREFLEGLLAAGLEDAIIKAGKPPFIERADMSSRENEQLIRAFKRQARHGGAVLVGLLGGRNSEGQDFPGDQMNGVIVCGIPYHRRDLHVERKVAYFESLFPGEGEYLGYTAEVIQRVNQACGRPLRRLDDKAVIVLIDERYKNPEIQALLSSWIQSNLEPGRTTY